MDNVFRYVEKCLYKYPLNVNRLGVLKEDLRLLRINGDVKAQQYEQPCTGTFYSPVEEHLIKIQGMEQKIKQLEKTTAPITALMKNIADNQKFKRNQEYRILLEMFYFGGASISEIAGELHVSNSTLLRRRRALIKKTASYLGLELSR